MKYLKLLCGLLRSTPFTQVTMSFWVNLTHPNRYHPNKEKVVVTSFFLLFWLLRVKRELTSVIPQSPKPILLYTSGYHLPSHNHSTENNSVNFKSFEKNHPCLRAYSKWGWCDLREWPNFSPLWNVLLLNLMNLSLESRKKHAYF